MQQADAEALAYRLRLDTPFWAGGVTDGRPPGPKAFQGVCKVLNKRKQLVPLIAHPWQLEYDAVLEAQRNRGQPMRAIILKARQLGFSTWTAAKFLQRCTQIPYQSAVVTAQDVPTANHILRMAKLMYAHLPTEAELGLGFTIKPDIANRSDSENGRAHMTFTWEQSVRQRQAGRTESSTFQIDTARSPDAGRGTTKTLVHLSEVAAWQNMEKIEGLLNAVPYLPETIVVMESTARGMNHFYERWNAATSGARDPLTGETYAPIFVPWHRDPNAVMRFSNDEERARFIDSIGNEREYGETAEDEPGLQELYGCTPEQLFWRRMQIRTQHRGHVELFHQENPANPEEAFISSGRPFFSGRLTARAVKQAAEAPAPVEGTLVATGYRTRRTRAGTINVPTGATWVPDARARSDAPRLLVFEQPVTTAEIELLPAENRPAEGQYVVAADIAEGAADTFEAGDFHAIQVYDHRTRMQVAVHESRIDRHLLPEWLVLIALYYNRAWLAVEVNSVGMSVADPIVKDYRYPKNYRRHKYGTTALDVGPLFGWKTSPETKPVAEDAMGLALESDAHGGIRHVQTARQLTTYITDERGRRGAMSGEHDDLLMAAMIAQAVMEEYRPKGGKRNRAERTRGVPRDEITGY